MARGRNVPTLTERWHLKNKVLVKKWKGQLVVQSWPKPYGPARSQAQKDTQEAFKRVQRALKTIPARFTIAAMEKTKGTGMYPRDILMQGMLGTNVLLAYEDGWPQPMIGDGLYKFIAAGGELNFTFDDIPQGYSALWLNVLGRTTQAQNNSDLNIQFNGDTSASYDWSLLWNTGNVNTRGLTSGLITTLCGSTAPSGAAGGCHAIIPGYANTSFWKQCISHGNRLDNIAAGEPILLGSGINWRSKSAIKQITFNVTGGFVAGSQATLYGLF